MDNAPPNGEGQVIRKSLLSIKDSLKGTIPGAGVQEEVAPGRGRGEMEKESPEDNKAEGGVSVAEAWKAYALSVEKVKPRVFSTLRNNLPVEEDGVYRITLNSEAQMENFRKNIRPELLAYIRKSTGVADMEIETRLAESENREKKVYTDSDKMEFLVKKNPRLADFSSRFGLDFDR